MTDVNERLAQACAGPRLNWRRLSGLLREARLLPPSASNPAPVGMFLAACYPIAERTSVRRCLGL